MTAENRWPVGQLFIGEILLRSLELKYWIAVRPDEFSTEIRLSILNFEFCVHRRNNDISKEQRVFLQDVSAEEEKSDFDDEEEYDTEDADPNSGAEARFFLYQATFADERCCTIIQ